jgi:hypothetical protein
MQRPAPQKQQAKPEKPETRPSIWKVFVVPPYLYFITRTGVCQFWRGTESNLIYAMAFDTRPPTTQSHRPSDIQMNILRNLVSVVVIICGTPKRVSGM